MSFIDKLDNLSAINAYDRRTASVNPFDWTLATVADIGTSLWNSVTFGQADVTTTDLLGKLGATGAIEAYNTHRDSVELASFVGGVLIPGMAAVKLTKAVREGNRAFYALSSKGKADDVAKITKLIEGGKRGQTEYRRTRNAMIAKGQINNLADTVAAEVAIMGTMNAHPFMEDYMADPVKNFGIGLVIGGGLTAPFSLIGTRTTLRTASAGVEKAALSSIASVANASDSQFMDTASVLLSKTRAADDIEWYVAQPGVNAFTKEIGLDYAAAIRKDAGVFAKQKLPKDIPLEEGNYLKGLLSDNSRFLGVDAVDFLKPKPAGFLQKAKAATVGGETRPNFVTKGPDGEEIFNSTHYYSPDHYGSFIPTEHVGNLASAADTSSAAAIAKRASKFSAKEPRSFVDELATASSADVEVYTLARLKFYEELPAADYLKASIVGDDLPAIHGWMQANRTRMRKAGEQIQALDPTDANYTTDLGRLLGQQTDLKNAQLTVFDKGVGTPLGYKEAFEQYVNGTVAGLKKAVSDGTPIEVAALRHNLTQEQAEAFLATNEGLAKTLTGMVKDEVADNGTYSLASRWQSAEQIPEALSMERRILQTTAKKRNHLGDAGEVQAKQRQAIAEHKVLSENYRAAVNADDNLAAQTIKSKLNTYNELYTGIQEEWINLTMSTSQSSMARDMMRRILEDDALTVLKAGLHEATNSVGGNSMISSADMVMRNMDQIGRLAAHLGDARGTVVNQAIQKYVSPITEGFRQIGKDPAARTEFALIDQFRQSSRGPLFFDGESGRFYRALDPETGAPAELIGPEIQTASVKELMDNIYSAGRELYEGRVTATRLGNTVAPQDIGLWIPSNRLLGKEYAYVQDLNDGAVKLLVGDTFDDLSELKSAYKLGESERIISRTRAEMENLAVMDDGRIQKVTLADVDKAKKGIGMAVPDISTLRLEEIAQGYIAQFNRLSTGVMEEALHSVTSRLDAMSALNQQAVADSGKSGWRKAVAQMQTRDSAADVKDYILGRNPANRSEVMRSINQTSDTIISYAAQSAVKAWEIVRPSKLGDPVDFAKYNDALKAAGIENPFKAFAEADQAAFFAKAKNSGYQRDPQRIVNAFNALASTTALKFLEIAQPMINVLSMPILMSSSISRMANVKDLNAGSFFENSQMAIMMSGVRRMNSKNPVNERLFKLAKEEGLLTSQISEVDAALSMAKLHQDTGAISKLESVMNSKFMEIASKPAEFGENLGRQMAFGTGVELAFRQLGANASDSQIMIFARDFMKQSVGNYSASQRPAMFQGSFGSAMGLFQTYMVTYAQNMYSHIERADRAGLTKLMLAQGGLFGTYSLPGFNPISDAIGTHFSDEHFDLKTGLYRAMPDALASTIVYGLPSNIVGALHTRGDVSPRIPSGFHEFVAPSMLMQYADTVVQVGKGALRMDENAGSAILEALSVQSSSRPVARFSELLNGYSVTKAGKMVAGSEEVWSFQGIMSRLLSTRTLNEAKAREVMHLNTVYGQQDRDNRQAVVKAIRQDLRNGGLDNKRLDFYAQEYLRSGSPQGFKAAVNEAYLSNENKGIIDLSSTLKDSPLTLLLEDLDL